MSTLAGALNCVGKPHKWYANGTNAAVNGRPTTTHCFAPSLGTNGLASYLVAPWSTWSMAIIRKRQPSTISAVD